MCFPLCRDCTSEHNSDVAFATLKFLGAPPASVQVWECYQSYSVRVVSCPSPSFAVQLKSSLPHSGSPPVPLIACKPKRLVPAFTQQQAGVEIPVSR